MPWFPKNKILVPIDFSEESFIAVETALQIVDEPAHVIVAHVLQEISPVEPGEIWRTIDQQSRLRHAAEALRERLARDHHPDLATEVLFGDPGKEISHLAEKEDVELIVLTSHGRTGLKRLLIGSVAERILRLAHCPVLVLRD